VTRMTLKEQERSTIFADNARPKYIPLDGPFFMEIGSVDVLSQNRKLKHA
jgi:hypothetical protein